MKLTPREIELARLIADGFAPSAAATESGLAPSSVRNRLKLIYRVLELNGPYSKVVRLAYFWNCELFQIGLKELGLIACTSSGRSPRESTSC
jgi:DNA-binding CsgD family transcriptional regulator